MKRIYEEPEMKTIDYAILEDVSLTVNGTLSSWEEGDGEDFGFDD